MIYDFIKEGDLVFDVGANVGSKSIEFRNLGARVIAFEPQPICYAILKSIPDITSVKIALDFYNGTGFIKEANVNTISSMSDEFINKTKKGRFKGYEWGKKINVNTDTLDNMIEKYGIPSYIKIDVEGYESNVLKGLTKKVPVISIEFTPELINNTLFCLDYLESLGYSSFSYVYKEDKVFLKENLSRKEMIEHLKSIHDYTDEFGDIYAK